MEKTKVLCALICETNDGRGNAAFIFSKLRSMANTYLRATNDTKASEAITAFAQEFGKINGVVK